MRYISTRGGIEAISFAQAVMMGLADDGGLLVPESIPDASDRLDEWRELDYRRLALEVMKPFISGVSSGDLECLISASYARQFPSDVAPLAAAGDLRVLELWHGPTMSFKDVALQFLGNLFEHVLARQGGELNILGATSGDTGSAAIHGVRGRRSIRIFMMHPEGRVSPIQRRQMTTVLDANVHNLAVRGSFDDCQRIMKAIAGDVAFKRRYSLGAVNSVNWARVLAQIVYYFHAVFRLHEQAGCRAVDLAVPTGNFGDVLAGWYARRMGLPIRRLILATNENDILARFFATGEYSLGTVHQTLSPAMDIQVASNFERYLFHRVGRDAGRLRGLMDEFARTGAIRLPLEGKPAVDEAFDAGSCGRDECLATIREFHERYGYLLDPHTAVGVAVARRLRKGDVPVICLATAHPAKFPEAIRQAVGRDVARHPRIDELMDLPERCETVPNDPQAVRDVIEQAVGR